MGSRRCWEGGQLPRVPLRRGAGSPVGPLGAQSAGMGHTPTRTAKTIERGLRTVTGAGSSRDREHGAGAELGLGPPGRGARAWPRRGGGEEATF